MGKQLKLEIPEYSERSSQLISDAHALYQEIGYDESTLPEGAFGSDKPISLVFAGQYSAGKSTILKALTGFDIATGHEITTEEARAYDWHGVQVVDTPGIGTGRRPEHDEISFKAIADADLLVYVVTYQGFDELIAQDFRGLLIDRDKAGEMILVVNKMRDANGGNSPDQRAIISEDLAKVTDPYTPEQLRVVFVDALAYLKSDEIADEKPERAKRLLEQSNFAELVDTLNAFVEQRGMVARLTTPSTSFATPWIRRFRTRRLVAAMKTSTFWKSSCVASVR
jgi:predicted GTPase